jgi:hypothetical protein
VNADAMLWCGKKKVAKIDTNDWRVSSDWASAQTVELFSMIFVVKSWSMVVVLVYKSSTGGEIIVRPENEICWEDWSPHADQVVAQV